MAVSRLAEAEKGLQSLCSDVSKLMDIAATHGDHLRDMFTAVPSFATKTELMAAVASLQRSKSSFLRNDSLETGAVRGEDLKNVVSQVEKALKNVSGAVKAASKRARAAEDLVQQQNLEITRLKASNRKLDLRVQAMENEMKRVSERVDLLQRRPAGTIVSGALLHDMNSSDPVAVALSHFRRAEEGVDKVVDVVGTDSGGGDEVNEDNEELIPQPLLSSTSSEASLSSAVKEVAAGPSIDLENILAVPGPRTREEIEREGATEKALAATLTRTAHIEDVLDELKQEIARQQACQDDENRKLALDVQSLFEQQRAQQALAGGTVSTEKLEGLIYDAVRKAGESIKKTLSKEARDNAQKKVVQAEERLSLAIERKIESFRPQIHGIEDTTAKHVESMRETSERLDALQDTLSLLDAEHSAIVSTVRQQEIERASSDHYCYAAIDLLIDMFDKYQHHVLLEKRLEK